MRGAGGGGFHLLPSVAPPRAVPFLFLQGSTCIARSSSASLARSAAPELTTPLTWCSRVGRPSVLADALGGTPPEWTLPGHGWNLGETLRQSGLRIVDWREQATTTSYPDIGAIIYTLLHVPWLIVDFHVERCRDRLYSLHQRIQHEGPFSTRGYSYLIEAHKP